MFVKEEEEGGLRRRFGEGEGVGGWKGWREGERW